MSSSKAKATGVSATSFFDLKAELSKKEADLAKAKAEGRNFAVAGVKRSDKKPTIWVRQNKGVKDRANRDILLEEISRPTLDSARSALERKAKIYEKLRKGRTGGLSDAQYDALLVDFDATSPATKYYEGHSSDDDESLTVPKPEYPDDPLVEYEDEFGRVRTAKRSEVPRNLMSQKDEEMDSDEDVIIRNPQNHFPVYEPTEDQIAEVERKFAEENNPLNVHYDASKEVRAKGTGFYQFSADEETRRRQMEELKTARDETERTRKEVGAEDIRPGQDEGMSGGGSVKSRAMEKRKREIEERRKLLESKRKKVKVDETTSNHESSLPVQADAPVVSPSAHESRDLTRTQQIDEVPVDPFATLEARAAPSGKSKKKQSATSDADAFLSQLEQEFLASRNRSSD